MPYKRVKATVMKKQNGSWTKVKTCRSRKKAKDMVRKRNKEEEVKKRR